MQAKILAMPKRHTVKLDVEYDQKTELYDDDIFTFKEAAQFLRISERTLYYYVENDKIPYLKAGRLLRFSRAALIVWLQKGAVAGQ